MQQSKQHLEAADTRNIVLAVDTSAKSEKMADWTIKHVARAGDHVHALHVIPAIPTTPVYQVYSEGMVTVLPGPGEEDVEAHRAQLHADLESRLKALLPSDGACLWEPMLPTLLPLPPLCIRAMHAVKSMLSVCAPQRFPSQWWYMLM